MPASPTQPNTTPNQHLTPMTFQIDEHGQPSCGGVNLLDLAKVYGTPLYVMDEATIRTMASVYRDTIKAQYPGESLVLYASKANLTMGIAALIAQEGLGIDVVSGGELYTAIQAGFPVEKIMFNGNNKTPEELSMAIHQGVGRISVDNFHELALIHQIVTHAQLNRKISVLLRITPGIECHTHDYIKTGQTDTKFGFDLSHLSHAIDLITTTYKDSIDLKGLHAHIGSQIFEVQSYEDLAEVMLNVSYNIKQNYNGLTMSELNLGGGLGIQYTNSDDPPHVAEAMTRMLTRLTHYAEQLQFPLPKIYVEPGRSIVATSGMTLYTVGSTKHITEPEKTFIAVDGGMGDNIRPALYQAKYTAMVLNKLTETTTQPYTVVGKYCESGDVLLPSVELPKAEAGDVLAVFATGAYNYAMASNYNRIPRPAVVMVENGRAHLMIKRETFDQICQNDLIPEHFKSANPSKQTVSA